MASGVPSGTISINNRTTHEVLTEGQISMLSGAVAGIVAGTAVCPLDVVKTTLQVQGSFANPGEPLKYRGILGTMRTLVHEEGPGGLYKGLRPMVLGYIPTWAIYFYVYGRAQVWAADMPAPNVISAVIAGACSTVVTNPIWVLKTRLMTQNKYTSWHYDGIIDAARTMFRIEGMRVFYSGLGSAFLGLPHVAIQFPLYEFLKEKFAVQQSNGSETASSWTALRYLGASILSKVVASTVTYPHEILRSRNQIRSKSQRYRGIVRTAQALYSENGWRAFYAGMGTNICRALPASAVTLVTFELISRELRLSLGPCVETEAVLDSGLMNLESIDEM